MKKLLMSSVALTAFAAAMILFQFSCKKDAIAETIALTKEEILIQKPWKIDQLHSVIAGKYASYFSGGTNTTGENYDITRYVFKSDGTGSYIDQQGVTYSTTWQFTSADKRTMKFTINQSSPSVNIWEMVEIAGNYMHVTQNFTVGANSNNLHSFRLIQIP